ncbi:uncharacterized protein LOC136090994 [Hydra vulgaris]|uniref:Uncharacterized protein LOC136090994 n=1 Tax=Hydra vulgaris TaxID=6087 RepID=A0ABM4DHT7_HYDVU
MPIVDNKIERFEFHEYEPAARLNLNGAGEIRINVEQQDLFTLPSEAYLLFEGQLVKLDGTAYANTDVVTLTNNGITHLFSQISYQLSNQDIETVYHPDTATTALLAHNSGFVLRQAYIIQKSATKETFSFCIPLRHIFGFSDDYDKVIYGFKHTITLIRKSDYDAIFKLAAAALGKVYLNKISLFIPHVIPSDVERIILYRSIELKVTLPVSFRARQCDTKTILQSTTFSWRLSVKTSPKKPRYIIVAFQTSKDGDQNANASTFDHCNLKNMYIMLNQERYPAVDYNLSLPNQQFSRAHRDAAVFNEKFYGMNELITHSNITPSDYRDLYPLSVLDVSKQSERLKSSAIDVQIKATFNTVVPADTEAIAFVISERMIEFQ